MRITLMAGVVALMLSGCSTTALYDFESFPVFKGEASSEEHADVPLAVNLYPQVEKEFFEVSSGALTVLAANMLADKLGVEFVEWHHSLNPYEFTQRRHQVFDLEYENPQAGFLALFDRSGLLPFYDSKTNTVFVHPYSMQLSNVNQSTVFTPLFDQARAGRKDVEDARKARLAASWLKYNYYEGYTLHQTISAWSKHAGYSSLVWYLPREKYADLLDYQFAESDYEVGRNSLHAIQNLIRTSLQETESDLLVSAHHEEDTNRLIIHPYHSTERLVTFEVEPTSVKSNLLRMADFYGYTLEYLATDYAVTVPYVTVLSRFMGESVGVVAEGYPVSIQTIESSKVIRVRNK
ncbi:hypothetical protein A6E01_19175 (plasmid) [Vibrio breoganii]|uniref:Uncharacterized protein n=1 Tax=Vibrio breoganii TaxID=553239 RepID=A0AAN0XZ00_9VIBR|nr:hypothetical protein [Vibrio breoganii]ANO35337.1 hypothetical protein A6E01_19175 [Vibrio breoganii]